MTGTRPSGDLTDILRALLNEPGAASFQLMGEDLALLSAADVARAGAAYAAALARLPPSIADRFGSEQADLLRLAHDWLRWYGGSVHGRIAGYLQLGRLCEFEYPWPVVAILGICQVM